MFEVLDTVCQPTRATKYSAMVDLFAREDVVIGTGETKIVPLGVKIDKKQLNNTILKDFGVENKSGKFEEYKNYFMQSHYLELHPRSSLRAKGLIVGVGIIDLDYPDEIGLIVNNPFTNKKTHWKDEWKLINTDFKINKGDKIAQCTLKEHKGYLIGIESDAERSGGFGSTGM